MKYSEFKAEVEKLGFFVDVDNYEVHVINHDGGKLMVIDKTDTHVLDPEHIQYLSLTHEDKSALLDLSVKLAKTLLAEREEEKRYWLRLSVPILTNSKQLYYYRYADKNGLTPTPDKLITAYQTIFAESEIAEMDITGFEKEPVDEFT